MGNMDDFIDAIRDARHIVFFTGAGVSTASGLRDFRGPQGLSSDGIDVTAMLSNDYLTDHPDGFWALWDAHMRLPDDVKPNITHETIAKLEKRTRVSVITMNIDGLHQAAGSTEVWELHGGPGYKCQNCGITLLAEPGDRWHVASFCQGGEIRPNAVLYGERLPADTIEGALRAIRSADCLVVAGTSLSVFPATGFLNHYQGGSGWYLNETLPKMEELPGDRSGARFVPGLMVPLRMGVGDLSGAFEVLSTSLNLNET